MARNPQVQSDMQSPDIHTHTHTDAHAQTHTHIHIYIYTHSNMIHTHSDDTQIHILESFDNTHAYIGYIIFDHDIFVDSSIPYFTHYILYMYNTCRTVLRRYLLIYFYRLTCLN